MRKMKTREKMRNYESELNHIEFASKILLPSELKVYLAIFFEINDGGFVPSRSYIAQKTELSRTTVCAAMDMLCRYGALKKEGKRGMFEAHTLSETGWLTKDEIALIRVTQKKGGKNVL